MYTGKQRFAEPELRDFMDQYGKEAKKQDDELDVRARPKQFKPEDEKSLINDNIFVTERPKLINDKKEEPEIEEADDKEIDDTHINMYKPLNIDHEASVISDNAISVGGITSRSQNQAQSKTPEKTQDAQNFGFQGIDFGAFSQQESSEKKKIKNDDHEDDEEDEEEEEDDEDDDDDDEDEDDDDDNRGTNRMNKQKSTNKDTKLKVDNEEPGNAGNTSNFAGKDVFKIDSDESEDEEDLEQNTSTVKPATKAALKQNFLF